jgi:hypothetical protein
LIIVCGNGPLVLAVKLVIIATIPTINELKSDLHLEYLTARYPPKNVKLNPKNRR